MDISKEPVPTAGLDRQFRRTPCAHVAGVQLVSPTTNVCGDASQSVTPGPRCGCA